MDEKKQKGLIKIIENIQLIIVEQNIQVGQKLPSERFLSDKLNVGRSSIREALRSLELLGVIYTKRGEGTFLSDMDEHQLFALIGKFLISTDKQVEEINELKSIIENHCNKNSTSTELSTEERILSNNNRIMYKIWKLLALYSEEFNTN